MEENKCFMCKKESNNLQVKNSGNKKVMVCPACMKEFKIYKAIVWLIIIALLVIGIKLISGEIPHIIETFPRF